MKTAYLPCQTNLVWDAPEWQAVEDADDALALWAQGLRSPTKRLHGVDHAIR